MRRARPLAAAIAATLLLTACGPSLPAGVVEGSEVAVGWQGELTSLNAATTQGATVANLDVAAATRSQFAATGIDGDLVANPDLGSVEIVDDDDFTVRFAVADGVTWSDGVPLDAADLALAWAAGSNALAPEGFDPAAAVDESGALVVPEDVAWFDVAEPGGLALATGTPVVDEFDRSVEFSLSSPVADWRTLLDVAVPAHVVGQLAFGIEDPMEAKQAVLQAIGIVDPEGLAAIAATWSTAFEVDDDMDPSLLLSSGPFVVADVRSDGVTLEVNRRYTGQLPTIETIELLALPTERLVSAVGSDVGVAEIVPTEENWEAIRDLERDGYGLAPTRTGEIWTLQLRGDRGVLQSTLARRSLLHAIPRGDVAEAGGGLWGDQMGTTDSVLFSSGTDGASISAEDSGFQETWGSADDEVSALERQQAGVAPGTAVCVVYDRTEPYAVRAFDALANGMGESGWAIEDCGSDDVDARIAEGGWDAVIARVPLPTTADEVAAQWGTGGAANLTGIATPERDEHIAESGVATDPNDVRDALVEVETDIVAQGVVLPLSNVIVAELSEPDLTGVQPRNGPDGRLTWALQQWTLPDA